MKSLLILVTLAAASLATSSLTACTVTAPGPGSNPGFDPGCTGDHCVCSLAQECGHDCTPGGESCEVQCHPGEPCDVGCAAGEYCHVECGKTSSCDVDCGSSPECHVTCPATGCTVTNCIGAGCVITCGGTSVPTHHGTTASCP